MRHVGFLNFQSFSGRHIGGSKYAYLYQILCRSVELLLRCGDFWIFTARLSYASAVLGVIILSVRLSPSVSVCHTCAL